MANIDFQPIDFQESPQGGGGQSIDFQEATKPPPQTGAIQAGAEQFAKPLTLGYLPQIQAKTMPAIQGAISRTRGLLGMQTPESVNSQLQQRGFKIQEAPQTEDQLTQENIDRQKQEAIERPVLSKGAEIAGAATAFAAPEMALTRAIGPMGNLAKIATASGIGGAIGAAQSPVNGRSRLESAGYGAAGGALAQGAAIGVGKGLEALGNASDWFSDLANRQALKASGAMLKDYRNLDAKGSLSRIGKFALDEGIVNPGETFHDVAANSQDVLEDAGSQIKDIYSRLGQSGQGTFDRIEVANDMLKKVKDYTQGQYKGESAYNAVKNMVQDFVDSGPEDKSATFDDLLAFRRKIDTGIKYSAKSLEAPDQAALYQARSSVRDAINGKADEISGNLGQALRQANQRFSMAQDLNDIATDRALRDNANRFFGLTEHLGGIMGEMAGGAAGEGFLGRMATGGVGAGIAHGVREYGAGYTAAGADLASKLMSALPKEGLVSVGKGLMGAPVGAMGGYLATKPSNQ